MELINKAELIVYVLGSKIEIDELKNKMKIEYGEFMHDYNRIHHAPKFMNKCINITFNRNADIYRETEGLELNIHSTTSTSSCSYTSDNVLNDTIREKRHKSDFNTPNGSVLSFNSSTNTQYGRSDYIKLPEQFGLFVEQVYEKDETPKIYHTIPLKLFDKFVKYFLKRGIKSLTNNLANSLLKEKKKKNSLFELSDYRKYNEFEAERKVQFIDDSDDESISETPAVNEYDNTNENSHLLKPVNWNVMFFVEKPRDYIFKLTK